LDTQDRERDSPHRVGPKNLRNLCGNLVELRRLWGFFVSNRYSIHKFVSDIYWVNGRILSK
jgi:hypothetical protein